MDNCIWMFACVTQFLLERVVSTSSLTLVSSCNNGSLIMRPYVVWNVTRKSSVHKSNQTSNLWTNPVVYNYQALLSTRYLISVSSYQVLLTIIYTVVYDYQALLATRNLINLSSSIINNLYNCIQLSSSIDHKLYKIVSRHKHN